MNRIILIAFLWLALTTKSQAQDAPFQLAIEPMNIAGLGGLQSFAHAQHDGKWLIIGGRLDGLHRRQPFAAFDIAGHNNQIIVVDPIEKQKWTAALSSLPASIAEHLSSTNMEFYQDGEYLYLIGGYGYSKITADHITYPNLTAVKVSDVIEAVIKGTSQSIGTLRMKVFPNPNNGRFVVKFNLKTQSEVRVIIQDVNGKTIENTVLQNMPAGENTYSKKVMNLSYGGLYYITLETEYEKATRKVIIEE